MKSDLRLCKKCKEEKPICDYYRCLGKLRGECKKCSIKRNVLHQKLKKSWKHRFVDEEEKHSYAVEYYSKNKEKFAEYRRQFKERNPDYYKDYNRRRKNEKY